MKVFLYKCEVCGAAKFSEQDHGRTWYDRCVGVCEGGWQYHDKIEAVVDPTKFKDVSIEYSVAGGYKKDDSQEGTEET